MPFQGKVNRLLVCKDSSESIVSVAVDRVEMSLQGLPDDGHSGMTRAACTRFPYLYEAGVEIRNSRQLTIVCSDELAEIAAGMGIDQLQADWLGANMVLSGIPSLSLLPPSTRLVFASKAVLVVDLENRPCIFPAQIIEQHHPGKGRHFIAKAINRRGFGAWVEREGAVECGDNVDVYFPAQALHPMI